MRGSVKSILMHKFRPILLALLVVACGAHALDDLRYTEKVGQRVEVFEHDVLNYRLDLSGKAYTYVDFSSNIPEASFAAIRFRPNAFSLVVSEDLGVGLTAEQYAEIVQTAMKDRFAAQEDAEYKGHEDIGVREERGMQVFQKTIYAEVATTPITYVLSAIVDGERAYQLLTFASRESDAAIRQEADQLLAGFSIIDSGKNTDIVIASKSVDDYRSPTFGYRFRARARGWFPWGDLAETNDGADVGALSSKGYGAIVMPVCWDGPAPTADAIYRIVMQQFGEDYPSEFISEERDAEKGNARGKLLIGVEENDGDEYRYYQWIVANERCAYTLAAWGLTSEPDVDTDLQGLWQDFEIRGHPTAADGEYENQEEQEVNAYLVNALGVHYFEARAYRDAFRFFAQATDLSPSDEAYITNALRSLVEIDAYQEAADWLSSRMQPFVDNQVVQSWDAWLAYQTGSPEKALRIYSGLFAEGYRDDDDFSVYMTLLADKEQWDEMDRQFAAYTKDGATDATQMLHAKLLVRRGRHAEALAVLDQLSEGRPFNADISYERMSIYDDMGNPAEVLRLADELITRGYRSLQSYYYKGDAEYQLRSYRKARESFEKALTYSPANANIREYLDAIDNMLGEGDTTTIAAEISPVALPREIETFFSSAGTEAIRDGYGAVFLSRIAGYQFNGSDTLLQTSYRKIRVLDDNGVTQFSTLEFDFDPSYEQLYVNSVVVRDAAGKKIAEGELNTYYITNSDTGYEASTEKTVHIPVPSLAPGVSIEAIVSKRTSVDDGTFPLDTVYLSSDRPIEYSAMFVRGQYEQLRFEQNDVPKPKQRGDALVWELQRPVAFRWEPLQPYFDQILPWVQLGTVSDTWADAGSEYLAQIEDKLDFEKVADRAQRLVEGVDSRTRQIEILSAYVQNEIHYEAIEFGRRAYIPKTARETMRDRYGDCKDHSVLLYSMLRAVGIDASLALVNLNQQVTPTLPNTDQFDHMIVSIPHENRRLYVDATDKDLRLGQLPPRSMAGNYALELGSTPSLLQIPEYASDLTGLSLERVVEARGDEYIDVTETARFTGYQAAELRGQLRGIETSEMQSSLQRWIASRYPDAELTEYFVENVFDAGYDLLVEIRYTLPIETDGTFEVPGFLEAYYLEFDRVADRRFPFEHVFPLRVSAVTSVKVASGQRVDEASRKPDAGESKFGNWRREVSKGDGSMEIRFDYVASDSRFDPEDYRDFAEFQRKAIDAIEQPLVLN